jgi:hypothetical protein
VRDLAVADGEHGNIPVGVPMPSTHDVALGGVLEHHDALGRVVVNGQIKAAVKNDHGAVRAVQLSDCGAALDMPRVARNCDHVVDGDVLSQEVKKVTRFDQPIQALLDDPEERIERSEVRQVGYGCLHNATSTSTPERSRRRSRRS